LKALKLAEQRDDRVMGAVTYHERTSMRTAMLLVLASKPCTCSLPMFPLSCRCTHLLLTSKLRQCPILPGIPALLLTYARRATRLELILCDPHRVAHAALPTPRCPHRVADAALPTPRCRRRVADASPQKSLELLCLA
jgi:hypothetical protein